MKRQIKISLRLNKLAFRFNYLPEKKIYYKTPMKIGVFAFAKRENNRILQ
ncbi:MAG: hypothetical protein ACI9T7_003070, partial [Oleiphilaceae bacterium]